MAGWPAVLVVGDGAGGRGAGAMLNLPFVEIVMPSSGVLIGPLKVLSYRLGGRGGGGADGLPPSGRGLDGSTGVSAMINASRGCCNNAA